MHISVYDPAPEDHLEHFQSTEKPKSKVPLQMLREGI